MEKKVYIVRDHGKLLVELLEKEGFQVVVGDGTLDDEKLSDCEVLYPGGKVTIDDEALRKAPELKLVIKSGTGIDRIDVEACKARGVAVFNTPGVNSVSVAEHTIGLMLAVAKKIYPISLHFRNSEPDFWCSKRFVAGELAGKTLGIVGLGDIGRRVAKIANAFDMQVIGYSRHKPADLPAYIEFFSTLEDVLTRADYVTLHIPGGGANSHLIGLDELKMMKSTAVIINTARGSVIDEEALIEALSTGIIAGAGLDVFTQEPLTEQNPLLAMENVVATPHCAGNTSDALIRTQVQCAQKAIEFYREY